MRPDVAKKHTQADLCRDVSKKVGKTDGIPDLPRLTLEFAKSNLRIRHKTYKGKRA